MFIRKPIPTTTPLSEFVDDALFFLKERWNNAGIRVVKIAVRASDYDSLRMFPAPVFWAAVQAALAEQKAPVKIVAAGHNDGGDLAYLVAAKLSAATARQEMTAPGPSTFATHRAAVAAHLRKHLQAHGQTRRGFAQRSGLGIAQILDLEKASSNPTLATLTRLATALGLTLQELVTPDDGGGTTASSTDGSEQKT